MKIKWFSAVRVTGLLLVLFYHYFKELLPGGFIGVDIFFTFSGYLITALLLDEFARTQAIDYKAFLRRRFYRIVPPLVLMVLVVMPFTLFVRRDFVADIGRQIAAALGFTTNLYETFFGAGYESQFIPHLFLHTWSLAIEVHFYLIWGALVWLLSKRVKRASQLRGSLFLVSGAFFVISFLTMFVGALLTDNVSNLYFSSIAHSFPFFVGSFVATLTGIKDTTKRFRHHVEQWEMKRVLIAVGISLVVLILLGRFLDFSHTSTYLIGFLLASLLAGMMIYGTRILHEQTAQVEEPQLLTFLSDTSYGVYLFHWPFYIIFSQLMPLGWTVFFTTLLSLIFASLSYYVLEPILLGKEPVLLGLPIDWKPYQKHLLGALAGLVVLTLGMTVTAPKVGQFETDLLVSSLQQANQNMSRTHTLAAGDATAISDVMVIGDSVALRASEQLSKTLPEAQVDAEVSRSFDLAYETFQTHIENKSLSTTVVLAVGVNSLYNYQEDIDQFVNALPKGHRLVLVSPYNRKDSRVAEVRNYELDLEKKYDYVTVADWYQTASDNDMIWVGTDGVHFSDTTTQGAELYAQTIQKAIEKAAKRAAK